jgi:hypothetical protein
MKRVKLICGEDIYYEPHNFNMLPIFREKDENKYNKLINLAEKSFLRIPHYTPANYNFGK